MDIRQLLYFERIARVRSLTKAAAILGIAQPALSKQVSLLERELGVRLLTRTSRGVMLTDAGSILAERASEILARLDQTRREIQGGAPEVSGQVSLGINAVPSFVNASIIAPLIFDFHTQYPQVMVQVQEGAVSLIEESLIVGRLDIAISAHLTRTSDLTISVLREDEVLLISAPDSKRKNREAYAFAELATLPLILPGPEAPFRIQLETIAAEFGVELKVNLCMSSLAVIRELVKRGAGYTLLPSVAVYEELRSGTLVAARIHDVGIVRKVVCATSRARPLSAAAELLRNQIVMQWTRLSAEGLQLEMGSRKAALQL